MTEDDDQFLVDLVDSIPDKFDLVLSPPPPRPKMDPKQLSQAKLKAIHKSVKKAFAKSDRRKRYYQKNKARVKARVKDRRAAARYQKYKLTTEDYDRKLQEQHHCCAICLTNDPGKRGWYVDHSHYSNIVRGLLCPACNFLLGFARENQITLSRAIDYLTHWKSFEI